MGRDFYQKPPGSQPKYRQADGQIVNFKPSPDAKQIGSGVKSAGPTGPSSGGSGTGVYQDAILRSRNKDNPEQPSTANSRTGSGQIKRMLRYPLSREAPYLATIRFIPMKQESTVDDVVNKLSGISQQVLENSDEVYDDAILRQAREIARAEATATVTSTGSRYRGRIKCLFLLTGQVTVMKVVLKFIRILKKVHASLDISIVIIKCFLQRNSLINLFIMLKMLQRTGH